VSDQQLLLLVVPIAVIQVSLLVLAIRDLVRPERRVRGDSKLLWGIVIVVIGLLGPILYFTVGREDR
jgi:hypothetical protein